MDGLEAGKIGLLGQQGDSRARLKEALAAVGSKAKIVHEEYAPQQTTDFTAPAQRIFDALKDKQCRKIVVVVWAGAHPLPKLMDLKPERFGIEIAPGGNILPVMAGWKQFPGLEGAIYYYWGFPKNPVNDWLVAEYKKNPKTIEERQELPVLDSLYPQRNYDQGYQWGMAIDLNACTGCSASRTTGASPTISAAPGRSNCSAPARISSPDLCFTTSSRRNSRSKTCPSSSRASAACSAGTSSRWCSTWQLTVPSCALVESWVSTDCAMWGRVAKTLASATSWHL